MAHSSDKIMWYTISTTEDTWYGGTHFGPAFQSNSVFLCKSFNLQASVSSPGKWSLFKF